MNRSIIEAEAIHTDQGIALNVLCDCTALTTVPLPDGLPKGTNEEREIICSGCRALLHIRLTG